MNAEPMLLALLTSIVVLFVLVFPMAWLADYRREDMERNFITYRALLRGFGYQLRAGRGFRRGAPWTYDLRDEQTGEVVARGTAWKVQPAVKRIIKRECFDVQPDAGAVPRHHVKEK